VPIIDGTASVTTSGLLAVSTFIGSHFITASYSGDEHFPTTSASLVQKVHASGTTTTLKSSSPAGSTSVILTAKVAPEPAVTNAPTGMVSFWDGADFLAQLPLNNSGVASTNLNFTPGTHALSARYHSDITFASSSGNIRGVPTAVSAALDGLRGVTHVTFTNNSGAPFEVLSATNLSWPFSNWTVLGPAMEILPGQYEFLDSMPATYRARFYSVRSR
jgi:hypothetical protein